MRSKRKPANAKKGMKRPEQILQTGIAKELYKIEALTGQEDFFFFHPANGGYRTPAEAAIFKAMGVRAGVSDLFFTFSAHNWPITKLPSLLILELKAGKQGTTDNQDEFIDLMVRFGIDARVIAADNVAEGIVEVFRAMLDHLGEHTKTYKLLKSYVFAGGVRL